MAALSEPYPFQLKAGKVMKQMHLEVRVTGMSVAKVRIWLGVQLLNLVGWIIGCKLEVTVQGRDEPAPVGSLALPPVRLALADLDREDAALTFADAMRIRIWLDGTLAKGVVAYDCEAGWVDRHQLGPDRKPFLVNGEIAMERVRGQVAVTYREPVA